MNADFKKTDFMDVQNALDENTMIINDIFSNMNTLLPTEYLQVVFYVNDMAEKLKPMWLNACLNGRVKKKNGTTGDGKTRK